MIAANQGRYNIDTQQVAIDGPVKVAGTDGFRLATSDVPVDLKQRQLASQGPARARCGSASSGRTSFAPTLANVRSCWMAALA